jgi:hypothetical protein
LLIFVTQESALFTESGSLSKSESVDLAILYEHPMTENKDFFSGLSNHFLHFESMADGPEGGGLWSCLRSSRYERCFLDEFVRLGGLPVSVPSKDAYSIFDEWFLGFIWRS